MMPLALVLACLQAAGAAAPDAEADIAFVIDSSNSMIRNDPGNARLHLARALIDFLALHGRARISVLQFAGWNESLNREVAPLVREPDGSKVLALMRNLPAFGEASDVNVAFERGMVRVLDERRKAGGTGPVWMVLLTDGEFDVVEERVRPEYDALAKKEFPQEYEQARYLALLRASMKQLESTLQTRFKDVPLRVSGVGIGKTEPNDAFKAIVAAGKKPGRILRYGADPLKGVLLPLLLDGPGFRPGWDAFYSDPKDLRVFAGSDEVCVLAWSEAEGFAIQPRGLQGRVFGEGGRGRVATFARPAAGLYPLETKGDGVRHAFHVRTALRPYAKRIGPEVAGLGGAAEFEIGLAGADGKPVADAELARLLRGQVIVTAGGAEAAKEELKFTGAGPATWKFAIPAAAPEGPAKVEVRLSATLPGGLDGADLFGTLEPAAAAVRVVPACEVSFDRAEAWEGQEVLALVRTLRGKPSRDAIDVALKGAGGPVVKLAWNEGRGRWEGPFRPGAPGTWSVTPGPLKDLVLVPGPNPDLNVKARALRIFQNGKPAEALVADVKYAEKAEYPLDVKVEVDAGPEEKAALKALFRGEDGVAPEGIVQGTARLVIATDRELPEEAGTLEVRAMVGGRELAKTLPVQLRFVDKSWKLWKKRLPWLAGLAALLLLGTWFALLRRFSTQEVRPYAEGTLSQAYPLRDWRRGLAGRKAVGTPEAKEALQVRMAGMKGFSPAVCAAAPAREGVQVIHNGTPVERPASALKHGDEVRVLDAAGEHIYYYFDRPPSPEELRPILEGLDEKYNIYVEEE